MILIRAGNYVWFNILLLVAVGCFVILLPLCDRYLCKKWRINIEHGISEHPNACRLLQIRKAFLFLVFVLYIFMVLYLVLFSRTTGEEYKIHVAPLQDVLASISLDESLEDLLTELGPAGIFAIWRHVVIEQYDIMQAFLNLLLFVPMGYLLPYIFDLFKKGVGRTTLVAFACSLIIENLQLIFRRGFYDFDDLIFNTLGGLLGAVIYSRYAFMVTNPAWKKDLLRFYHFRKRAKDTALFPYSGHIESNRVTLAASMEEAIYSFYVEKLGFYLQGQYVDQNSAKSSLLLRLGSLYVEFICSNDANEKVAPQNLHLRVRNLDPVRSSLKKQGISADDYGEDFYTKRRFMKVKGPDGVCIVISE